MTLTFKQFSEFLTPQDVAEWKADGVDVLTPEGLQEAYDWYVGTVETDDGEG